jgi:hypothetical protein
MGTDLDLLVVGNTFLQKNEQKIDLILNYKERYGCD